MNTPTERELRHKGTFGKNTLNISSRYVLIVDNSDKEGVYMHRDEAIEIAKHILLFYGEPFCNRVSGSGV